MYVPGVGDSQPLGQVRELSFEKCEHFANILYGTVYIWVTPRVPAYYSNRSQSLILLTVQTHS